MTIYKIDENPTNEINKHIANMDNVLNEIAVTYAILLELLESQASTLSAPSIDLFREGLKETVNIAVVNATIIREKSAKLVKVSEQASKHLSAVESRVDIALQEKKVRVS